MPNLWLGPEVRLLFITLKWYYKKTNFTMIYLKIVLHHYFLIIDSLWLKQIHNWKMIDTCNPNFMLYSFWIIQLKSKTHTFLPRMTLSLSEFRKKINQQIEIMNYWISQTNKICKRHMNESSISLFQKKVIKKCGVCSWFVPRKKIFFLSIIRLWKIWFLIEKKTTWHSNGRHECFLWTKVIHKLFYATSGVKKLASNSFSCKNSGA